MLVRSLLAALAIGALTENAAAQAIDSGMAGQQEIRDTVSRLYKIAGPSRQYIQLEVYRTLDVLGIPLTLDEELDRLEVAIKRGAPEEGLQAYEKAATLLGGWEQELNKSNVAPKSAREARSEQNALKQYRDKLSFFHSWVLDGVQSDRNGGLDDTLKKANSTPSGRLFLRLGDAYYGARNWARAESYFASGLRLGKIGPLDEAIGRLSLGLAQFRSGKLDDAKATWSALKSSSGLDILATVLIENVDALQRRTGMDKNQIPS